ncbi:100kDa protein [Human adenovirus D8]|uniref:Shutoff protein n=1 Tax=Human adenovirus D serotype 8 TaxID=31545 RepID=A0A1P7YXB6_ADE08|nr:100kDa protein [Human adenovirus D8]BBE52352.1 100kDa protein [Human mastadenovirus D]AKR79568.1 100kDa protein [Human adenovirus D8]AKR79605.1 100kDa protein [Human adenovirus D8]AKR79642.1 100kDa protein [Human adenovirus D8]
MEEQPRKQEQEEENLTTHEQPKIEQDLGLEEPARLEPPHDEQEKTNAGLEHGYLGGQEDVLLKHLQRQSFILRDALADRSKTPLSVQELCRAYELNLFSPRVPPKRQPNGTCEPNPRLNFYPVFAVPEALATYHIFFKNQKIPVSCRANRTRADALLALGPGARIPDIASLEEVPKIFEGLGRDETRAANALKETAEEKGYTSALVELEGDNARLAVLKRSVELTHFAYPAVNLPPKVMRRVMDQLITPHIEALDESQKQRPEDARPVVSDEMLARWLGNRDPQSLEQRRKLMLAVVLVTLELECMRRFFSDPETLRKVEETLHYTFRHGFVRQACKISNVELTNLVSCLGILHENRLGQTVLHSTLKGEARRDYIRDCVFLFLCHTWQSAMGVWQQCLQDENLKELDKLLAKNLKKLWTGFDERTVASDLAEIVFPERLRQTLKGGLPDFMSQSMLQNYRTFILERSGILPATCNAFPSDFVPLSYRQCPPPLWSHCYLLQLANYIAHHSDVIEDVSGEGLLECHCRCNLCSPHRSLVCNPQLLSETQVIGTFELQGPENSTTPLKLTPGLWTSAYLRKFVPQDYHAHEIKFFEDQLCPQHADLTACVITQGAILAQLHAIQKSRQEFLLKKGKGVYLDPQTGEVLNPGLPQHAEKEAGATSGGDGRRMGQPGRGGRMGGGGGGRIGRGATGAGNRAARRRTIRAGSPSGQASS